MPQETTHYRIEYPNGSVYHIVASTNVEQMDNWDEYFQVPFNERNGLASLFMTSDGAKKPKEKEKNLFDPEGDAHSAAKKLIEKLNELNGVKQPLFSTEY